MKKMLMTAFFQFVLLLSCITTDSEQIKVENNVMFYAGEGYELFLDIAYPVGGGKHPALIFILGSGWGYMDSNRIQFFDSIKQAACHGYTAVTIDHRKTSIKENGKSVYQFPSQLEDIQHASDWLVENRRKYKIDTKRFGIIGWCTGGHLAMMHAFSDNDNPSIQAVVDMEAPVDLVLHYNKKSDPKVLTDFIGGPPGEFPEMYKTASPINYISEGTPPVLMIYGEADKVVPPVHGFMLEEKLDKFGVPNRLIIIPEWIHKKPLLNDVIWTFLDEYLKS